MNSRMTSSLSLLSFEQLHDLYSDSSNRLKWGSPFVLPLWLKTWFNHFGHGFSPYIAAVSSGPTLLGVAPLMVRSGVATFMGSESVCDFQAMIAVEGLEKRFYAELLHHLEGRKIISLTLGALRPDSSESKHIPPLARDCNYSFHQEPAGNIYEMSLPATWQDYLCQLSKKYRHEIRRKNRRLNEYGKISYLQACNQTSLSTPLHRFFEMFAESRPDKAAFLADGIGMRCYFESLAGQLALADLLHLGFLDIDEMTVGTVFAFSFKDTMYLYNNGYAKSYAEASVGFLSKVYSIRFAIEQGMHKYSFLKGDEQYKKHLGGSCVPLSRCSIGFRK